MLTSLCREYYEFILAQGVLSGLMNGLSYTPAVSAVNQYFFTRRPLAMGIASSGSSLAGVIFPIALNRMLNRSSLGFGWSVRIVGFIMLAISIIACITISSPAPRRKAGSLFLPEAWKNRSYTIQNIGLFLVMWGIFVPFFYIPGYAISVGIGIDLSGYLIGILNTGSLCGRLLGGAMSNKLGRSNGLVASGASCSILILLLAGRQVTWRHDCVFSSLRLLLWDFHRSFPRSDCHDRAATECYRLLCWHGYGVSGNSRVDRDAYHRCYGQQLWELHSSNHFLWGCLFSRNSYSASC